MESVPAPSSRRPSGPRVGGGGGHLAVCVQAKRGRLGPKKVTQASSGTLGARGLRTALDPPSVSLVPGGRGSSLGGATGPGGSAPGSRSETLAWKIQARGRLSVESPPPPQGPPFLDQVQARAPCRATHRPPPPLPSPPLALPLFRTISPLHSSFVSFPPLSLHRPCSPPPCPPVGA